MGAVIVGDQRPPDQGTGSPVVPDAGGQGRQPLGDPGVEAFGGAAAVAFEVELAFEGVVDRFDPLPDPADRSMAGRLVAAVRPDHAQAEPGGDQLLEVPAREPLVPDQGQPRAQRAGAGGVRQQLCGRLAFADLGIGQAPGSRHPVRVVIRYSFSPQNQRECAAQYP